MKSLFITVLLSLAGLSSFAQWSKTTDPSVWNTSNYLLSKNGKLYVAANSGVFVSDNNGQTWSNTNSKDINPEIAPIFIVATTGSIYAGGISAGSFQRLFPIKYDGQNWTVDSVGFTEGEIGCLYATGTRVYASTVVNTSLSLFTKLDTEPGWTKVTSIPTPNVIRGVAKLNNTYYAFSSTRKVWTSTDGVTFTETTSTIGSDIKMCSATSNALYIGTYDGVYKSTDGATYTRIDNGFAKHIGLTTISGLFADGNEVYAGSFYKDSAYKSIDGGVTWTTFSDGELNEYITSFAKHNNAIFATQREFGQNKSPVIRYGTATTTGASERSENTIRLNLFPNPASTMVAIETEDDVQISLYNYNGALILKTETKKIDVSVMPRGIYFLQLNTNKGVVTQKLIVE
jgi:hypothetical protein